MLASGKQKGEGQEYLQYFYKEQVIPSLINFHKTSKLLFYYCCSKVKLVIKKKVVTQNASGEYLISHFIIVHNTQSQKTTFFFLKKKEDKEFYIERMKRVEDKQIDIEAITNLLWEKKKLVIKYDQDESELTLRFQSEGQEVNAWKQLIYFYRPELKLQLKSIKSKQITATKQKESLDESLDMLMKLEKSKSLTMDTLNQTKQKIISTVKYSEASRMFDSLDKSTYKPSDQSERQKDLQDKISHILDKLHDSERKISELLIESTNSASNHELDHLSSKVSQLAAQIRQKQSIIAKLHQQNKMLITTIEQLNKDITKFKQQQIFASNETLSLKRETERLLGEINQLKKSNQTLTSTKELMNKRLKRLESSNQNPISMTENSNTEWRQKQNQLRNQYTQMMADTKRKYEQCQFQKKQLVQLCEKRSLQIRSLALSNLFNGDILENHIHFKQYLKDQLEKFTNMEVVRTKQIYKFDIYNKVNFHHYIDGKTNILLIVRTSNGTYLAGFSESPILSTLEASNRGLIISLTNSKIFRCLQNKQSVIYDDYYIIFGNSQLRIKSQEHTIFSNFGISNEFYFSNGSRVDILLGQNSREVSIEDYQVFQIEFQQSNL